MSLRSAALSAVIGLVFATGSFALSDLSEDPPGLDQPYLRTGAEARPTRAAEKFCERLPAECRVDPTEPDIIALTRTRLEIIQTVNFTTNRAIRPVEDQDHWGVVDQWDFAEDGRGDCEDYALVKRRKLAALGFPRRAMRMTVVIDEKGEGHAVLLLHTTRGDLILDNKHSAIFDWHDTGYAFIKRESSEGPGWVSVH